MFYFALLLILLGLGSLLYTAISMLRNPAGTSRKADGARSVGLPEAPGEAEVTGEPKKSETSRVGKAPGSSASSHLGEVPRARSEHPAQTDRAASKSKAFPPPRTPPALETVLHRDKQQKSQIADQVRIMEKKQKEAPMPEESVIVSGVLFFDHERQLPHQMEHLDQSPLKFFSGLKRSGQATIALENNSFVIHGPNASYRYFSQDLDQILFLQGGIGLVPLNQSYPVPVFLTEESEKIKSFIKRNSRIRV